MPSFFNKQYKCNRNLRVCSTASRESYLQDKTAHQALSNNITPKAVCTNVCRKRNFKVKLSLRLMVWNVTRGVLTHSIVTLSSVLKDHRNSPPHQPLTPPYSPQRLTSTVCSLNFKLSNWFWRTWEPSWVTKAVIRPQFWHISSMKIRSVLIVIRSVLIVI